MYAITPATLLALASSIALIDTLAPAASSVQATGYGAPVLYCGPKFNNAHCPTGSCWYVEVTRRML